ncbi:MAG TPA: competence/damage-inducible protein A [Candidatus Binatia bacterium]|nr:competence/damage-inducible protein A [Candidatus Binatia bacterium]
MIQKVIILSTGDELTTGKVVDTNSAHIAERVFSLGLDVVAVLKVGDTKERLLWALDEALKRGDLVIGTGGLGPTADDLTTAVVAEYFGVGVRTDEGVADALKRRFEARGFPWTENNLKQAVFPEGAAIVPNPVGTAPGFRIARDGKTLIWLSGVPREMEAMLKQTVLPWIAEASGAGEVSVATFKINGLTESKLDDLVKSVTLPPEGRFSFRAHFPDLTLKLTMRRGNAGNFAELTNQIRQVLGAHVYAEGDVTLEEVAGKLLREKGWSLALAESCTGGVIAARITRIPGSSEYFKSSVVSYSNESKMHFLGVKESTLKEHGAVSRETAVEMAEGALRASAADIALSTTGVAGPGGGSEAKPVGTVWIGLARRGSSEARLFKFSGDRDRVINGAAQSALNWLRTALS